MREFAEGLLGCVTPPTNHLLARNHPHKKLHLYLHIGVNFGRNSRKYKHTNFFDLTHVRLAVGPTK